MINISRSLAVRPQVLTHRKPSTSYSMVPLSTTLKHYYSYCYRD